MLRVQQILLAVLALVAAAPASEEDPFNVDFRCGWGGYYRPMEWTPVEIEIGGTSELTEPFAGSFTVSSQQDGMNMMNVTNEFVLTPDIRLHLPLVTKIAYTADKCSLTIRDERGRTQWAQDFNLWDFSRSNRLGLSDAGSSACWGWPNRPVANPAGIRERCILEISCREWFLGTGPALSRWTC
jgi:hypothetical protein